ncbi:hypothetical protein FOA52_001371 [Chlamydomonas sp. UWO 241]|nr:hypothetical protein FOA52_001371 [Chlamydomonas sp. UWO 241]
MVAAGRGQVNVMSLLLDCSGDPARMMMIKNEDSSSDMFGSDENSSTALMWAAAIGQVDAMRLLLDHPSADAAAMIMLTDWNGSSTLMRTADNGHVEAMRLLLCHPSVDAAAMMRLAYSDDGGGSPENGCTAVMLAAAKGHVDAMRLLLDRPSADAAMLTSDWGKTALMQAAENGRVEAMRLLLGHPSTNPAAMMILTDCEGLTALMLTAQEGHVESMRLLLDHPSADAAAMLMHTDDDGATSLMVAAVNGQVDVMRLLLNHPSADAAAMMAVCTPGGASVFTSAARFAAGQHMDSSHDPARSCTPLLLLLRRVAVESEPGDAQQAHMTKVMEALCQGPQSVWLFDNDMEDATRDECVRLLLARGADNIVPEMARPLVARIIRDLAQLASVPQLINDAVVGMAVAQRQSSRPWDNA